MGALYTSRSEGITEEDKEQLLEDAIIGSEALSGILENLLKNLLLTVHEDSARKD
jgi:hypothetical protein